MNPVVTTCEINTQLFGVCMALIGFLFLSAVLSLHWKNELNKVNRLNWEELFNKLVL